MNSFDNLPEKIKIHLKALLTTTGLPQTDDSLKILAANWLAKLDQFVSLTRNLSLAEVGQLASSDKRGALLLTYSGSLIGLGPESEEGRYLEYVSLKLRSNIPRIIPAFNIKLASDISVDSPAQFSQAPLKSTSAIYKIAVCSEEVPVVEQTKRIREAMLYLTNAFLKLNHQSLARDKELPEQFTYKNILRYLSRRNMLTQKQIRTLLDDFFMLVETGLLLGEKVALGKIGRLKIVFKPPRKPRVMKNRFTGKEMTIPALPARYLPKMIFNKKFKKKVSQLDPEDKLMQA